MANVRADETVAGVLEIARGIHCCANILFLLPEQRPCMVKNVCVYMHISDCIETVYGLPLLPNNLLTYSMVQSPS